MQSDGPLARDLRRHCLFAALSEERLIEVAGDEVTIPGVESLRRHMH